MRPGDEAAVGPGLGYPPRVEHSESRLPPSLLESDLESAEGWIRRLPVKPARAEVGSDPRGTWGTNEVMNSAMDVEDRVVVVGAGLAGTEAAWQLAERGVGVVLYDMKPERRSPAHASDDFAELVCSNSLRANTLGNAVGLLKEEMRQLGSLVLRVADQVAVPAGKALAVDRVRFAAGVTEAIESHPRIEIRRQRVTKIPDAPLVILATGPLTDAELAEDLSKALGEDCLYFYDAISPTIHADSIDESIVFRASRYDEAGGDYLNVPLSRDEYEDFVESLLRAETVPFHSFEAALYFEGCLPIEEMARRGRDTLAFGPMKPVGLVDPRTGRRPHAVVQLRQEDREGTLWNLVGCQTKLRVGEQKRLFRRLPGLGSAVFARFGSIHRNTYVNAPLQLDDRLQLKRRPGVYLAGQMAGVEGYVESAALGFLVGVGVANRAKGLPHESPPHETAHGALLRHLQNADARHFQPMNVNYGLFPPLDRSVVEAALLGGSGRVPRRGRRRKLPRREKNEMLAARALDRLNGYRDRVRPSGSGVP